jgi:hypothetical protein
MDNLLFAAKVIFGVVLFMLFFPIICIHCGLVAIGELPGDGSSCKAALVGGIGWGIIPPCGMPRLEGIADWPWRQLGDVPSVVA